MNINIKVNHQIILIILVLALMLCLYLYNGGEFKYLLGDLNEGFENIISSRSIYGLSVDGSFPETIFERSLKNTFTKKRLICNILPTEKAVNCYDNDGRLIEKELFPVHILMVGPNKYLAVFNDGKIYSKKNLIGDKFWKGPLINSMPGDTIPLRMIALDAHKRLLGVGYDNKIYRKQQGYERDVNFISIWDRIPNTDGVICVLYESGDKSDTNSISSNDKLLAVNKDGLIQEIDYDKLGSESFNVLANDLFPVVKIFYDKNGYLLGIGEDFRLYRKATKLYDESVFNPATKTETQILDAIYDIDAKMYGLVFLETIGKVEMMKQNMSYFASKFMPLEMTEFGITKERKINANDIVKFKTGVDKEREMQEWNYETLKEVEKKLELDHIKDLRKLCADRGHFGDVPYHNFDFINRLQNQKEKITELNKVIRDLVKYDPESAKIQESIHLLDNPNISGDDGAGDSIGGV